MTSPLRNYTLTQYLLVYQKKVFIWNIPSVLKDLLFTPVSLGYFWQGVFNTHPAELMLVFVTTWNVVLVNLNILQIPQGPLLYL